MLAVRETEAGSFEAFLEEAEAEYSQALRELEEIDLLIEQTTKEVERLAARNAKATNQLRQVEASIDTVPREDIEEAYTTVLNAQQSLFTMRGQLEKLQSDQKNVVRRRDILGSILEHSGELEGYRADPEDEEENHLPRVSVVSIIEAQERERRRLSRRMHDGPAQTLTNLILQAEICERLLEADPGRAREELRNLRGAAVSTFQAVKGFILDLRPMMLDDLGLVPTLRQYIESFSAANDLETELTVLGKERRLAPHHEVTTFRIIQDLLRTAKERGHARTATIRLEMETDRLQVTFDDDGEGFDLVEGAAGKGLGLAAMRERVEMLGGELDFDGGEGDGNRVRFHLPLP